MVSSYGYAGSFMPEKLSSTSLYVSGDAFLYAYNSYEHTVNYKFDFVLDEYIKEDDPRIKSLLYIAKQNSDNVLEISFYNANASNTAKHLALLFTSLGIKVLDPVALPLSQSSEPNSSKYVIVGLKLSKTSSYGEPNA